jgi:hypothetical protein
LSAFIAGVERGSKVEPGPRDGRQVLVLANAARESYLSGRPVKL